MQAATGRDDVSLGPGSRLLLTVILIALFAVPLVRTAWMSDDAYITLRTIDNFVRGYGLRWNVAERVQSYTDPLWMLLLAGAYGITREAYFTSLFVSMSISVAAFAVVLRLASSWKTALIGGVVLIFSKAFVDYSTSGLENPLTHLLIGLLLLSDRRGPASGPLFGVSLSAGLLVLTRLDLALLVLPLVVTRLWRADGRRALAAAVAGLLPIIVWEAFSVVYYGFPFPNTAYAKLQTGASTGALVAQGLEYLLDSIEHDPVTLLSIVVFTLASMVARPHDHWPVASGIGLYAAYIIAIGGDFMSGRFFTAPLFYAVAAFVREPWRLPRGAPAAWSAAVAALGLFATTRPAMISGPNTFIERPDMAIGRSGISDERTFYYRSTGMLLWNRQRRLPRGAGVDLGRAFRASAPRVVTRGQVGFFGYFAGPEVHVIDIFALGDPLLARLPAAPGWRIGHFERSVPEGYVETIQTGANVIRAPDISMRYTRLKLITQGPIWSRRRWRAIVEMNLGD